ncbi:MAG: hypothetical protein AAB260_05990 [Planctomycetota bacterium]
MPHKEPDYETVILLKLGAIEGRLRSFMSSLGEPPERKRGGISKVEAPADGRVRKWYWNNHDTVGVNDTLCEFEFDQSPPRTENIPSPAEGKLYIVAWEGDDVLAGALIATVEPEYSLA